MFRPTRSSVDSSSFPTVSGSLRGHDPATQTLGRKAALDLLEEAVRDEVPIQRFMATAATNRRPDDIMFLLARRLESRVTEVGWDGDFDLARLDTWTFICPLSDPELAQEGTWHYEDLALELTITVMRPRRHESVAEFARRVIEDDQSGRSTAQGT